MAIRKLPPKDSEQGQEVIRRYLAGDRKLHEELGYSRRSSFTDAMVRIYGVRISEKPVITELSEPEVKVMPAPKIKIKPLKQEGKRDEGEEVQVQDISDGHVGLQTPSYNSKEFGHRLDLLADRMVKLCYLHRKMRPIKKLVTPILGDMVQGEQYGIQGHIEEFEMGAEEQIFNVLLPKFTNFYINLLQVYEEIEVDGVPGNHGNIQRRSQTQSKRSNWDTVFYRALKQSLSAYKQITVNVPEPAGQWYLVSDINGWDFLNIHGDQMISYQGIPFYGIERRAQRWKQSIGVIEPFDYMNTAHVHNPNFLWNNGIPTYINGCFITDSPYPLVRMGLKDVPQQWSLFVNRKYGVTASYRIDLSRA